MPEPPEIRGARAPILRAWTEIDPSTAEHTVGPMMALPASSPTPNEWEFAHPGPGLRGRGCASLSCVHQAISTRVGFPGAQTVRIRLQCRTPGFNPWFGTIPRRRACNPLQYSCLENPHGRRSLEDNSPQVTRSRTWLSDWAHTHTQGPIVNTL